MNNLKKVAGSDEEDDLESLRLAALQSLKRKNEFPENPINQYSPDKANHYRSLKSGGRNKRGRFFGSHQGRAGKSTFNRVRNTNLISITTVSDETNAEEKAPSDANSSLTLPQDRYCKKSDEQNVTEGEGTSKFSRYNDSDKSESESESEDVASEDDNAEGKLKRADSLEALMQELDDEIQGKPKGKEDNQVTEEKPKTKKAKKKKRTVSDSDTKKTDLKVDTEKPVAEVEAKQQEVEDTKKVESEAKESAGEPPVIPPEPKPVPEEVPNPMKRRARSRSPFNRRVFHNRPAHRNYSNHAPNFPPVPLQYGPPPNHFPPHVMPFPNHQFGPMFAPPGGVILPPRPAFLDRPLSPLAINTESLTTATMAPLSPRSAAFVLQNKAIIEKRRRSPRRSYSRSLSRSLSRSPRRSLTPPRRFPRRSISPRRSPRRVSPKRRSLSPKRRSVSPRRAKPAKNGSSPANRQRARERAGTSKSAQSGKDKDNGVSKEKEAVPQKEEKPLDPVLEARKRKFESNEIGKKGIIRLRPKEEKSAPAESTATVPAPVAEEKTAEPPAQTKKTVDKDPEEFKELEKLLNEDALLEEEEEILLDQKVEDIFSDDDFASDNEGRFKAKKVEGSEKVATVPFSRLLNGVRGEIKSEALPDSRRSGTRDRGGRYGDRRARPRSPADRRETDRREVDRRETGRRETKEKPPTQKKTESQDKPLVNKHRIMVRSEKSSPPVMDRRFERKIEIKIKNPSKYEKAGKSRSSKKEEDRQPPVKVEPVEAAPESDGDITVEVEDDDELPKCEAGENRSGDEENSAVTEGDLRAQLSRKRAEKLHKLPSEEEVSSRLIQFALQGAVFKKSKKKSRDKSITTSEIAAVREILHADYFSRKFCVAFKTDRKVQVYKPRYKRRKFEFRYYRRPDGKLPIHLRLGIAGHSEIFEDVKVKKKSRKRKNREVLEQFSR